MCLLAKKTHEHGGFKLLKVDAVLILAISAFVCFGPYVHFKTVSSQDDLINGRKISIHSICGIDYKRQISEGDYTKLIKKYGLEDKPNWVNGGSTTYGLGTTHRCSTNDGILQSYESFKVMVELGEIADPKSEILRMRKALKDGGTKALVEYLDNLKRLSAKMTSRIQSVSN